MDSTAPRYVNKMNPKEPILNSLKITGRHRDCAGYIRCCVKNHPFKNSKGQVFEHRLIIEQKINRYLARNEIVHHKNGIRDDNREENLELTNKKEHWDSVHHNRYYLTYNDILKSAIIRAKKSDTNGNFKCRTCFQWKNKNNFKIRKGRPYGIDTQCKKCHNNYCRGRY